MKVIDPLNISTTATHARASSATYWDYAGALQTVGVNVLRQNWDRATATYQGVLIEPARTNLLLNNTTLSTQTRTVTIGATYTLSFYGSGTITLSGAAAIAVPSTGGGPHRTTYTFTAATTSLTLTVTGAVYYAQLELGSGATSLIVTAGAAVTRAADVVTGTGPFLNSFTDATATYAGGTTYGLGDVRQYDGRLYESLQAANTGNTPSSSPAWWLDTGPTNATAMFDRQVSTQSTGLAEEQFIAIKLPSNADALALLNISATSAHLIIGDGYSSFEGVYSAGTLTSAVISGGPPGTILTVAIKKTGSVPVIGEFVTGLLQDLGETQLGLGITLVDYSRKATDEFGVTSFVERPYSKRMSCSVLVEKAYFNSTMNLLLSLRAQPSVWVATDDDAYSSASLVYGFLRDMRAVIQYPTTSLYSLEIEGLI